MALMPVRFTWARMSPGRRLEMIDRGPLRVRSRVASPPLESISPRLGRVSSAPMKSMGTLEKVLRIVFPLAVSTYSQKMTASKRLSTT